MTEWTFVVGATTATFEPQLQNRAMPDWGVDLLIERRAPLGDEQTDVQHHLLMFNARERSVQAKCTQANKDLLKTTLIGRQGTLSGPDQDAVTCVLIRVEFAEMGNSCLYMGTVVFSR